MNYLPQRLRVILVADTDRFYSITVADAGFGQGGPTLKRKGCTPDYIEGCSLLGAKQRKMYALTLGLGRPGASGGPPLDPLLHYLIHYKRLPDRPSLSLYALNGLAKSAYMVSNSAPWSLFTGCRAFFTLLRNCPPRLISPAKLFISSMATSNLPAVHLQVLYVENKGLFKEIKRTDREINFFKKKMEKGRKSQEFHCPHYSLPLSCILRLAEGISLCRDSGYLRP